MISSSYPAARLWPYSMSNLQHPQCPVTTENKRRASYCTECFMPLKPTTRPLIMVQVSVLIHSILICRTDKTTIEWTGARRMIQLATRKANAISSNANLPADDVLRNPESYTWLALSAWYFCNKNVFFSGRSGSAEGLRCFVLGMRRNLKS